IMAWSDAGDINAGRGSKTAINATPAKPELFGDIWVNVFRPPAVGSGIGAWTFDPDGVEGPLDEPPLGNIYLFVPEGVIDAGEAGIYGGRVVLGATEIRNVQNISFSFGSVGVPTGADSGISMGALSGMNSLTDQSKMLDQASGMVAAKDQLAKQNAGMGEQMMSWLDVKVIGFETDETKAKEDREQ
ncbi:MAG: filamentous hemagglutinin family protein, partial [Syntrophobacteraceae bacterium]